MSDFTLVHPATNNVARERQETVNRINEYCSEISEAVETVKLFAAISSNIKNIEECMNAYRDAIVYLVNTNFPEH